MHISVEWLREFCPAPLTAPQLRDLITARVATVEGMEALRTDLAPFVVARVVESGKVEGTKLSFNKVDDGSGTLLDVVCGAPNVTVGACYPFARSGTVMPDGLKIEKRKIRGHTSNGMLCSARELGLGQDADGILTLETDAAPGTPLLDVLPVGDVRLLVDVLPNRPDLLSHLGVAREVAAATRLPLGLPRALTSGTSVLVAVTVQGTGRAGGVTVTVDDAVGCPRYAGVLIRGVQVGPSPKWLAARVEATGGRSINNVVDASNYLLHAIGQPTHAFDAKRLSGDAVVVRRARAGETIVTLDGVERKLTPSMLVIADAERPVAIAGVMGGRDSEVTSRTTDLFFEVAYFAPSVVRPTRRALGLSTDASYRFERGIDRADVARALALGVQLIQAVAGGTVEGEPVDVAVAAPAPVAVRLTAARLARVLGIPVSVADAVRHLEAIGFTATAVDAVSAMVHAPSWRVDVQIEDDLIEEVARLHGYDAIPDELRPFRPGVVPDAADHVTAKRIRAALVGAGLHEAKPLPFVAGTDATHARVLNPLAEDEPHLRRSVLESLARRAEYNLSRMQGDVRLFEVGAVFTPREGSALPAERQMAGLLVMGDRRPAHFTDAKPPAFDAWDAKGLAEQLARAIAPHAAISFVAGDGDALWTVSIDGTPRGEVRAVALDAPVWASPAFGVELSIGDTPSAPIAPPGKHAWGTTPVAQSAAPAVRYRPLPTTPAAEFDLALLVPLALEAGAVEAVLRAEGGELLESLVLFDEYRGKGVPEGQRSLAWRLTFRHPDRTLRDKEIDGRRSQLLKALEKQLGVTARTA
ncbi:MAG: phenylalanine--tRNA ligase subunit beta [Gemmatimonadaceae bacterium]|nr:phenylalanine--tRNA ligase subunit beta [Gemmatimonadaceae bacterium]